MNRDLVIPATGELISLDAPTDILAHVLEHIREIESDLRDAKRTLSAELHARMDVEAQWTVQAGKFKLTGQSPESGVSYDPYKLTEALAPFLASGAVTPQALNAAVERITTYKVRIAGVNALKRLGGEVRKAIEAVAEHRDPSDRRVSVSRA